MSTRWGNPQKSKRTEIRGMCGGKGLMKTAEIVVRGHDERWGYEFTLPKGRYVKSNFIFDSAAEAKEEAERFAKVLLGQLGVSESEMAVA